MPHRPAVEENYGSGVLIRKAMDTCDLPIGIAHVGDKFRCNCGKLWELIQPRPSYRDEQLSPSWLLIDSPVGSGDGGR